MAVRLHVGNRHEATSTSHVQDSGQSTWYQQIDLHTMINLACCRAPFGPSRYVRWGPYPVLASEGPQGYSFPFLYVPCTPVIHEDQAKDVVRSLCCVDCTAQGIAGTNESCLA